jgi:hypothetical protein
MRSNSIISVCSVFSLALLVACGTEGTDDPSQSSQITADTPDVTSNPTTGVTTTGPTETTPGTEEPITALYGQVLDAEYFPIEGVTVETSTGLETTTDSTGRWGFEDIADLGRIGIDFSKPGYAHNQKPITIVEGAQAALNVAMAPVDFMGSFSPNEGLDIDIDDGGAEVSFPTGDYTNDDGEVVTGEVFVEATLFDVTYAPATGMAGESGSERDAAPGDFTAVDSDGNDLELIESFGMVQVNITNEKGEPLTLPEGETATVRLRIQGDAPAAGEFIPAWSYDEENYRWVEEGDGLVEEAMDGSPVWSFEASHFSTWNCDQPVSTWGCVRCNIAEFGQLPISGVSVSVSGVSFSATTTGSIDADGQVCANTKNDSTVALTTTYSLNGVSLTQTWDQNISIPPFSATCSDLSGCTDIGTCPLDIPL